MFWQLAPLAAGFVVSVLVAILDYVWRDKRTTKFRRTRQVLLFGAFPLLLLVSIASVVLNEQRTATEKTGLLGRLDALRERMELEAAQGTRREGELRQKLEALHQGNSELQAKLNPFVELAKRRHPAVTEADAVRLLQQDVERMSARTARLERQTEILSPRSLAPGQRARLVGLLAQTPSRIVISSVAGDGEARALADELYSVMRQASWLVLTKVGTYVNPDRARGLWVCVDKTTDPVGLALRHALNAAGLEASVIEEGSDGAQAIQLWVGSK